MKQHLHTSKPILLATVLLFASLVSCKKDYLSLQNGQALDNNSGNIIGVPGAKVFDVARFKNNLKNALGTQPRGYTFVINKDGVVADSLSFGNANFMNGMITLQNTKQEINIASVSKTITAVAVFQLLELRGKTVDSTIGEWLPKTWNCHPKVRSLTFGELLSHTSGITEASTNWSSLRSVVSMPPPGNKAPFYSNVNFALYRIIIPYLVNKNACTSGENQMPANEYNSWLSAQYLSYMQSAVFSPIGLASVTCKPSANSTWMMTEAQPNSMGVASFAPTDWTELCGGGGFYMSALEMARFMAYLSQTNNLLDNSQRNIMDNQFMGWDLDDSPMTVAGRAYGKGGALWQNANANPVQDAGDAGLQTLVVKYPNKVQLSLAINSIPGQYRNVTNIATTAYNNAWVNP